MQGRLLLLLLLLSALTCPLEAFHGRCWGGLRCRSMRKFQSCGSGRLCRGVGAAWQRGLRGLGVHVHAEGETGLKDHRTGLRVAVVGGMAGLALARHLLDIPQAAVTVFDMGPPGQTRGATAAAAGLLHPLTPRGKLIWKGEEGMRETLLLVEEAQRFLCATGATSRVVACRQVVRPALEGANKALFSPPPESDNPQESQAVPLAPGHARLKWLTVEELEAIVGSPLVEESNQVAGALVADGLVVDTAAYVQGLWLSCESRGCQWKQTRVESASELIDSGVYDHVVFTAGAGIHAIPELQFLLENGTISLSRGQSLVFDNAKTCSEGVPALRAAVLCGEYVVPVGSRVICGATHEHLEPDLKADAIPGQIDEGGGPANWKPLRDPDNAVSSLAPVAAKLFPPLADVAPVDVTSAIRVNPKRSHLGKIPIFGRSPSHPNVWYITALGSRGLIHHAYLAQQLASSLSSPAPTMAGDGATCDGGGEKSTVRSGSRSIREGQRR